MNFNMNMRKILLTSAVALSAATAFAAENQTEVVTQQKSLLEKLDSLNAAVLGLKINGTAKAGVLASFSSSDQYAKESPTQENQAFTDVNLRLTARPSSETMIDVQLRLHKDWQSAYDENNNPIIGHWFSYDGTILNKHVDFNLGYMRVGYTPLTVFAPQTEILQEPEIFSEKRREALEKRNLDTTSRRLLQGLNIAYQSGSLGAVDNITAQLTGARLRNTGKKVDQVFFDFDFSDRYMLGARAGIESYGAHLGLNFVNLFDRKYTRRTKQIADTDTIYYDNNRVFSADLSFDSKKTLPDLPVSFGLNGEFAMSKWKVDRDYLKKGFKTDYKILEKNINGDRIVYIKSAVSNPLVVANEDFADESGNSFYANLFVKGDINDIDFKVDAGYLKTDEKFWSEMASSPVYQGRSVILNANAMYENPQDNLIFSTFGASSLENLYFNVYNSTTLQATNLMTSANTNTLSNEGDIFGRKNGESGYLYSRLDNNYKNGHFYRNGYTGTVSKRLELDPLMELDPSVGLALPFGLATPDRKGITAKADVNWADKVMFNARVNILTQLNSLSVDPATGIPQVAENKFTEYAVGLGVDAGALAGLDRQILIQGSYSHAEESAYLKRTANRIVAGVTADVWGPIALLVGFQQYEKEFGNGFGVGGSFGEMNVAVSVTKASERLVMGGVRVKLAPISYLTVQYGMLTNDLDYAYMITDASGTPVDAGANKLSISKNIVTADVTVNF
ncbi:MAG: hypothetical protein IKN03_10350 [Fibrobacter sp.]|nr:hypothetical protein [Fibrobacter sp.]